MEKAEADVLAGIDQATWAIIDQIVLEVHDLGGRLRIVTDQLTAAGFSVTHDQDRRLALTPCHNVYARRPGARPPAPPAAPPRPQTMAALTAELRAFAARRDLPVPAEVVWLARIDGDPHAGVRPAAPAGRAPAGAAAAVLSGAWTELFGPGSDRPDADFFDLGGDSLTAVRLLAKLEAVLGEDIVEPDLIFTASRFADLAEAIARQHPPWR
ncbi:MAG: phosphopantetheine-binding protein [Streptosporangiaceae bacterium]